MLVDKLKYVTAGLLVLILVSVGIGWVVHHNIIAQSPEPIGVAAKAKAQQEEKSQQSPRFDRQGNLLPPGALARLGSARFRHEGVLGPFALSPDGRTVAAGFHWRSKSVAFWDAATGQLTRQMTFDYPVHSLAFSPDGKSLAIGSVGDLRQPDGGLRMFDLGSGAEKLRFGGAKDFRFEKGGIGPWGAVFFTPDGRTLINHHTDGIVRMWDAGSGKQTGKLNGSEWNLWDLSPDGKLLAVAQERSKNILRLMDVTTGREVRQLKHSSNAGAAVFSPDGKILAVAIGGPSREGRRANSGPVQIALWSLESGKSLGVLPANRSEVTALAFSPDSKTLASAGRYSPLCLWDVAAQKEIKKAEFQYYSIFQLAFSRDGKTLVLRGDENHLRLWDVAAWRERFAEEGPGHEITAVVFSPDGKLAAGASPNHYYAFGPTVWVWKTDTGELVRKLDTAKWPMWFTADGKSFAAEQSTELGIWDIKTWKRQSAPRIGGILRGAVAMSPDAKVFASWDRSPIINLVRADVRKRLPFAKLPDDPPQPKAYLSSLCLSLDGKTLYAGGIWKQILRWDVATGNMLVRLGEHDGPLSAIALSADGRTLAAMTMMGSLYLWELASGQARLVQKDAGPANLLTFSPDGRFLALSIRDDIYLSLAEPLFPRPPAKREQIRLLRLADGKEVRGYSGHLGSIDCLNFSPDGRRLASGGHDTTVLLWDVPSLWEKNAPLLDSAKRDALWAALQGTAEEAHRGMATLTAAPNQAVPLLRAKLKPASVDAARVARLLKQLDSDQFREREEAVRQLKKLDEAVEPGLYKALKDKPSLEMRRRLQQLLDEMRGEKRSVTGERLRSLRALEVLERIGDRQAREVLRHLSEGEMGTWLMEQAKTARERLQHRSVSP